MPAHQKKTTQPDTQQVLTIGIWKAVAIAASAAISLIVGTAFTLVQLGIGDHYTVIANTSRVAALETKLDKHEEKIDQKLDALYNGQTKILELLLTIKNN